MSSTLICVLFLKECLIVYLKKVKIGEFLMKRPLRDKISDISMFVQLTHLVVKISMMPYTVSS